jgi:hypothetical protein
MACLRFGARNGGGAAGRVRGQQPDRAAGPGISFASARLRGRIIGYLPRHLQPFSPTLDYVSSVAKFALVAAPLGCAVSALTGVISLHLYGGFPPT